MKKYLALFLFVSGLLLLLPGDSQANIAAKESKILRGHSVKLGSVGRVAFSPERNKARSRIDGRAVRSRGLEASLNSHKKSRKARKTRVARHMSASEPASLALAHVSSAPGLEELREYYQNWRGTRYRLGGVSHAGIDCSGFTALAVRDVYGLSLPRTAREQAMWGKSVGRDDLLPGDLVFFKRGRNTNHVGIYMGNDSFMHASTSQGVMISSLDNVYWRNKFWKGSRLYSF